MPVATGRQQNCFHTKQRNCHICIGTITTAVANQTHGAIVHLSISTSKSALSSKTDADSESCTALESAWYNSLVQNWRYLWQSLAMQLTLYAFGSPIFLKSNLSMCNMDSADRWTPWNFQPDFQTRDLHVSVSTFNSWLHAWGLNLCWQ